MKAPADSDDRPRTSVVRVIDYHASRLLCFRAALTSFFRRWGLYVVIGILVVSAGTNAPLVIAVGLACGLIAPMRLAAAHGWTIVPAVVVYAIVGALPVALTRPLWWPRRWGLAERALPLAPEEIRRSDRLFALLMMAPWQGALAIGAIGVSLEPSSVQSPDFRIALAGWLVSVAVSVWLSSSWMRRVRELAASSQASGGGLRRWASRRAAPRMPLRMRRLDVRIALLVLPLWRGRALRTAVALACGLVATALSATGPCWSALPIEWAFALTAVAAACITSVLRAASARELQPLWLSSRSLPVDVRACEAARFFMVLAPMIAGLLGCLATASHAAVPVRPQVVVLYAAMLVAGCVIEALTDRTAQPQDHAARWLLMLIAAIAFASEISSS